MFNHNNPKIYKIVSENSDLVYYGSTTTSLKRRLEYHIKDYKRWKKNNIGYISSFEILKYLNCKIILVEEIKVYNKKDLLKRERYYIENNKCVNIVIPTRTISEYSVFYRKNNIQKIKKYKLKNKERDKKKRKSRDEKNDCKEKRDEKSKYDEKYRLKNKNKISLYLKNYNQWKKIQKEFMNILL